MNDDDLWDIFCGLGCETWKGWEWVELLVVLTRLRGTGIVSLISWEQCTKWRWERSLRKLLIFPTQKMRWSYSTPGTMQIVAIYPCHEYLSCSWSTWNRIIAISSWPISRKYVSLKLISISVLRNNLGVIPLWLLCKCLLHPFRSASLPILSIQTSWDWGF